MTSQNPRLEASLVKTLKDVGRPLNMRRLRSLLEEHDLMGGHSRTDIEGALAQAIDKGTVVELRRGIYIAGDDGANRTDGGHRYERRRRRRSRLAQASQGFPAAPLSLEETAAMSAQADDPKQLQKAVWVRLSRRAAEVAGLVDSDGEGLSDEILSMGVSGDEDEDAHELVEPLADFIRSTVRNGGLRLKVKARRRPVGNEANDEDEWTDNEILPQVRYSDGVDAEHGEWVQTFETVTDSVIGGRAPFRDVRREDREFANDDRRGRKSDSVRTETLLTDAARKALEVDGRRRTIADLDELVVESAGLEGGELRARIMSENERKRRSGNRPVFVVDSEGKVGLTDWDLPRRYTTHEERLKRAELELREIVKRALLERVAGQSHKAFRRLMFMLLERLNFTDVREFRTIGEKRLALVARREAGVDDDETAIIVDGSWDPIDTGTIETLRDNLDYFEASAGLVITVGTFSERAVDLAAEADFKRIRLLDGASLATLLAEHGLGAQNYRIRVPYVDGGFFSALGQ